MVIFLSSSECLRKKTERQTTKWNATGSKEPEARMRNAASGLPGRWDGACAVGLQTTLAQTCKVDCCAMRGARVCGEGLGSQVQSWMSLTCVDPAGSSTRLLLPQASLLHSCVPPLKPTSVLKAFQHLLRGRWLCNLMPVLPRTHPPPLTPQA